MNFFFAPQDLIRKWVSISVSREKLGIPSHKDLGTSSRIALHEYRKFMQDVAKLAHIVRLSLTNIGLIIVLRAILAFFVLEFCLKKIQYRLPIALEIAAAGFILILSLLPLTQKTISRKMRQPTLPYAHQDFSTGLSWRNAKDPKDMAYGTWAMLQRAGATMLPKPDYSLPVGDIYRQLAFHLLRATNSLSIISLASQQGCPNQPSWVPDWSKSYTQRSGIETSERDTNQRTKSWITSGETEMRRLLSIRNQVELDPTGMILTVQANVVGQINSTFLFGSTCTAFPNEEERVHVHNLRLALMYVTKRLGDQVGLVDLRVNRPAFPYSMLELLDIAPEVFNTDADSAALETWARFINRNYHKSLNALSSLLVANENLLSSHIVVCNLLATQQRTTVMVDLVDSASSKQGLGACWRAVKVGDQIVRVEGLSGLLVVRPLCDDIQTEVRIVSSINLAMIEGRWWDRYMRKQDFNPHFAEYRIH